LPVGGDGSSAFVSKVRSRLLVLRKMGGWIRLVSVPAVGGGGEFLSENKSAWGMRSRVLGAWPRLMGFSAMALSRSHGRVSSAASFKAFARWSTLRSGFGRRWSEAVFPGDGNDALSACKGSRDLDLIFFFLRPFVLARWYCCTPYSCTVYLYLYWYLYAFLN